MQEVVGSIPISSTISSAELDLRYAIKKLDMQKILSGSARGRTLNTLPKNSGVRPILSRIKKSIFDILQMKLGQARFLDLYAGTGSVGLEALSRGAKECVFVEIHSLSLRLLHQNIELLKFEDRARVMRMDVLGNLSSLGLPFDLIFMGPPYVDEMKEPRHLTELTLQNIERFQLLKPQGIVVAQHHKKEPRASSLQYLKAYREEKYGDTIVEFFGVEK